MNNQLLFHYEQELALAHQLVEEFAKAHPKIAGRLNLDGKNIADSETARLLQTFALSNAKLTYDLEDDFSFLSDTLLNSLHPTLYAPLPAFSVVQFEPDFSKLNHKLHFEKHLLLRMTTKNEEVCFFRTCYDVTIHPILITEVKLIHKPAVMPTVSFLSAANAFFRIRLQGIHPKIDLAKADIDTLRFFIHLPVRQACKLYELIFNHCVGVIAISDTADTAPLILSLSDIQPAGFHPEKKILPFHPATSHSYRLLTEFFAFPEKFLFFDIHHLSSIFSQKCAQPGDGLEIIFYLDQSETELEKNLKSDHLKLFSTPVINLFEAKTARTEIKPTQKQYLLATDKSREIYHVDKVNIYFDEQQEKILSPQHYHVLRKPAWEGGEYVKLGTESFLYLQRIKDFFSGYKNPHFSSNVLCMNREIPSQLSMENQDTELCFVENKTDGVKSVRFLKKITTPDRLFIQPNMRWQYLSSLNVNYFSLTDDQKGLEALKNLLEIYMLGVPVKNKAEMLKGLLSLRTQRIATRSINSRENCFCQGIKISLQIDEVKFGALGIGLYLFCQILSYFLAAWFSRNIMVVLRILSSGGKELYTGKPRQGESR